MPYFQWLIEQPDRWLTKEQKAWTTLRSNGPNKHTKIIPLKIAEYTFFLSTYGTFASTDYIDHILGHKRSLKKFNKVKIEIIPTILSNLSGMKLEINSRGKLKKSQIGRKLNNILLKNQ